jgi:hypothetical protein
MVVTHENGYKKSQKCTERRPCENGDREWEHPVIGSADLKDVL